MNTGELYLVRDTNQPGYVYLGRTATRTVEQAMQQNNRMSVTDSWDLIYRSGIIEEPVTLEAEVISSCGKPVTGKWYPDTKITFLIFNIDTFKINHKVAS